MRRGLENVPDHRVRKPPFSGRGAIHEGFLPSFSTPMECSDTCFCSFGHTSVAFVAASFRLTRNILMPTILHNPPSKRPKTEEILSKGGPPKIIFCTPPQEGTQICTLSVLIFFSLTEPPLPDPTLTPPNTPGLARSRPKLTELDRNRAKCIELDILQAFRGGGEVGGGCHDRGGAVREKENHYLSGTKTLRFTKTLALGTCVATTLQFCVCVWKATKPPSGVLLQG